MKKPPSDLSAADLEIIGGLTDFRDALRDKSPIEKQFTVRTVELTLRTREYDAHEVQRTRKLLKLSQPLFAQLLGVSVNTVRSWEHGLKPPSPIACRFLDEINISPDHWRERLRQIFHAKGAEVLGS